MTNQKKNSRLMPPRFEAYFFGTHSSRHFKDHLHILKISFQGRRATSLSCFSTGSILVFVTFFTEEMKVFEPLTLVVLVDYPKSIPKRCVIWFLFDCQTFSQRTHTSEVPELPMCEGDSSSFIPLKGGGDVFNLQCATHFHHLGRLIIIKLFINPLYILQLTEQKQE